MRVVTVREVVVDVSWKVRPLPTTITSMMYRMIMPLISSAGGRPQVMVAERGELGTATKLIGGALGAVER